MSVTIADLAAAIRTVPDFPKAEIQDPGRPSMQLGQPAVPTAATKDSGYPNCLLGTLTPPETLDTRMGYRNGRRAQAGGPELGEERAHELGADPSATHGLGHDDRETGGTNQQVVEKVAYW